MVTTHTIQNIKVKGQLVQYLEWKQTDGRTRPIALAYAASIINDEGWSITAGRCRCPLQSSAAVTWR